MAHFLLESWNMQNASLTAPGLSWCPLLCHIANRPHPASLLLGFIQTLLVLPWCQQEVVESTLWGGRFILWRIIHKSQKHSLQPFSLLTDGSCRFSSCDQVAMQGIASLRRSSATVTYVSSLQQHHQGGAHWASLVMFIAPVQYPALQPRCLHQWTVLSPPRHKTIVCISQCHQSHTECFFVAEETTCSWCFFNDHMLPNN